MNHETEVLLFGVVDQVEQAIRDLDCPAVVALQGDRLVVLSDYDYLRDAATATAFEFRTADHARAIHATRFVFAVPQVWLADDTGIAGRAVSNHPLRDGEQEVIAWMAYDQSDGVDYGHVSYARRPNGEPVFGDPEVLTTPVRPYDAYPGLLLLRALTSEGWLSGD